jgi:hemerythrin-like metal-binding protein
VFEWNPSYSVNIGSIDAQHRSLLAVGRELCTAMSTGQSKAVQVRLLDRVIQFAAMHFAHEERLMRAHAYPAVAAHQAEHEAVAARVVKFRDDLEAGRKTVSNEVLEFLETLLVNHFQEWDSKYSPFLCKKAVA